MSFLTDIRDSAVDFLYRNKNITYGLGGSLFVLYPLSYKWLDRNVNNALRSQYLRDCNVNFSPSEWKRFKKGYRKNISKGAENIGRASRAWRFIGPVVKKIGYGLTHPHVILWRTIAGTGKGLAKLATRPFQTIKVWFFKAFGNFLRLDKNIMPPTVVQEVVYWVTGTALEVDAGIAGEGHGIPFEAGFLTASIWGGIIANIRRPWLAVHFGRQINMFGTPDQQMCAAARAFKGVPALKMVPIPPPHNVGVKSCILRFDPMPWMMAGTLILIGLTTVATRNPALARSIVLGIPLSEVSDEGELFRQHETIYRHECASNPKFSRMCEGVLY